MSRFTVYILIIGIILGVFGFFGFNYYNQFYGVPKDAPTGEFKFTVETGDSLKTVAKELQDRKVINSSDALLFFAKLNQVDPLQEGEYTLNLNKEKPEELLKLINAQTKVLASSQVDKQLPVEKITFREGIRADQVFSLIEAQGVAKASELAEYAKNPANFDRKKYEFLPEPLTCTYGDVKNCALYYIEGYLYPDTYNFYKPSTAKEIYTKFLDNFKAKVWTPLKSKVGNKNFQEVIIMASVLEKETGRPKFGVSDANRAEVNVERSIMAGVFYNRLADGMKWGSDVTVEYTSGRKLCQQTFKVDNCLFLDEPAALSPYSTYQNLGYPIGPITSPQFDNVNAVLNPTDSQYLYFVSDVTGKKYFGVTEADQKRIIAQVNEINRKLGL